MFHAVVHPFDDIYRLQHRFRIWNLGDRELHDGTEQSSIKSRITKKFSSIFLQFFFAIRGHPSVARDFPEFRLRCLT